MRRARIPWIGEAKEVTRLWRLARKYLCVPSTSTQAKRVFVWLGFLLKKRMLSLSGERVSSSRTLNCNPLIVKLNLQ